jgi:transcription elongation factor Elf1
MNKIELKNKNIYVWDCPVCAYDNQEEIEYMSNGDRVQCHVCGNHFEVENLKSTIKPYDNYYKTKSRMLLNVHKSVLNIFINHGLLQEDENVLNALKIIDNEIELKKHEDDNKWQQEYVCVFSNEQPNNINDIDRKILLLEERASKLNESEKIFIESLLTQIKKSLNEYRNYSKWVGNDKIYKNIEKELLNELIKIENKFSKSDVNNFSEGDEI